MPQLQPLGLPLPTLKQLVQDQAPRPLPEQEGGPRPVGCPGRSRGPGMEQVLLARQSRG